MSTTELIVEGRKKIKESDESLIRSEKLVAETIDIGTKTAEKLHDQTKQLERVVDDLDQIHFSMKKANRIIRDITRSIATDKWVMLLLQPCQLDMHTFMHGYLSKGIMPTSSEHNILMTALHTFYVS